VNDVVLAITGGALRRYLVRHRALPSSSLLALVPVSARDSRSTSGGNQTSGFVTTLATDIADPRVRLAQITRLTRAVKLRHDQTGAGSLVGLLDLVPPRAGQQLARLAGGLRLTAGMPLPFNVVVSNVPGPDTPFYLNGALVESAHPVGPIADVSALNVTVVSYRRQLAFGVIVCPDVVTDLDGLRDDLVAEINVMRSLAAVV
jgi:diacylglycerol O-acyltransferase